MTDYKMGLKTEMKGRINNLSSNFRYVSRELGTLSEIQRDLTRKLDKLKEDVDDL
jgi:hypothetical protein